MKKQTSRYLIEVIIHVVVWAYIIFASLAFHRPDETIDWNFALRRMLIPLCSFVIFYLNYFYLVPKLLLREQRRTKSFVLVNIINVLVISTALELYVHASREAEISAINQRMESVHRGENFSHHAPLQAVKHQSEGLNVTGENRPDMDGHEGNVTTEEKFQRYETEKFRREKRRFMPKPGFHYLGFLRNFLMFLAICAVAVCIRLSLLWQKSELARQKLESERKDAELKVLQHQVSPHFLLNSLNNIYSLIAFDQEQAQQCILELSKILRYQLYESTARFVPLSKEVEFLENYISLMKIRMSANTKVTTDFQITEDNSLLIAPNILISIVENAFKHGVSPTEASFVNVRLETSDNSICFHCENSNFPKSAHNDRSGGGLGLQQVAQMLELCYPNHYEWIHEVSEDGKTYSSNIIIKP